MPERIQLQRTAGWRKPEGAVVVSRPSRWGNPYIAGKTAWAGWYVADADEAVKMFRRDLAHALKGVRTPSFLSYFQTRWKTADDLRDDLYDSLRGRDLACWCKPDAPCHADVLLNVVAEMPERETSNVMVEFAAAYLAGLRNTPEETTKQ